MVGDKSGGPEKFLERIAEVATGDRILQTGEGWPCDVHLLDELCQHRHALFILGGTRREHVRVIRYDAANRDIRDERYAAVFQLLAFGVERSFRARRVRNTDHRYGLRVRNRGSQI